ncbi:solute carrier family 22 member 13-like [Penaeus indicus]|uniref:solute carrier family 22 member 13-like n=1 Tax=Penaeus indicus TaxID=29960 RepID=UPI00300C0EE8
MHFEDLLEEIGSFGLYQRVLCFVLIPFSTGMCALTFYSQLFILTAPPHVCRQGVGPEVGDAGAFLEKVAELLNTTDHDSSAMKPYTCHRFSANESLAPGQFMNVTSLGQLPSPDVPCDSGWDYDYGTLFSSLTSEHDWVCDEAWRPYLVVTAFWVGNTIGSWIFGTISDVYGRRPTILMIALVYGVAGVASVFVSDFYGFLSWIPESSSWLIARGRSQLATKQLEKVAKVNKRTLLGERVNQLISEGGDKSDEAAGEVASRSVIQLVRYRHLRNSILLVLLVWMLGCMCYYGHCQNTAHLGSNMFTSYLLGAAVEIPSWSAPWLINRLGRRLPLTVLFLLSGGASVLYALVPLDMEWLSLTLALVGRSTITGAYYITLQYGPEVFPTVVRGQGVALAETLGGIAIFLSPSIVYLGEILTTLPLLVFGGLSVIGGAATLFLPETNGVVLPQTLPQAEKFCHRAARPFCRSKIEEETEMEAAT